MAKHLIRILHLKIITEIAKSSSRLTEDYLPVDLKIVQESKVYNHCRVENQVLIINRKIGLNSCLYNQ
jgi:hypothetical protein